MPSATFHIQGETAIKGVILDGDRLVAGGGSEAVVALHVDCFVAGVVLGEIVGHPLPAITGDFHAVDPCGAGDAESPVIEP